MKSNFNKVIDQLKREELSSADKGMLKREILKSIRETGQQPIASPWSNVFLAFRTHTVAFVAVVTIIFTGGGFALVAEGALPGEALYSIKVNFNEEVRDAIALHPSQKAQWSAEKARRRLQEAETLSTQGRLSENLEADLQNRLIEHATEAREAMASLEEQQNLVALMEAASSLESVLSAHKFLIGPSEEEGPQIAMQARTQKEFIDLRDEEERIGMMSDPAGSEESGLSALSSSSTEAGDNAEDVQALETMKIIGKDSFLQIIEANLKIVSQERERAEESLSLVSNDDLKNVAHRLERKAEVRGKITRSLYSKIESNLNTENREYAEKELEWFDALMAQGQKKLDSGEYRSAVTIYNQASGAVGSLEIFLNSLVIAGEVKERQAKNDAKEAVKESDVEKGSTTSADDLLSPEEPGFMEKAGETETDEEAELSTTSSSTVLEGRGVASLGSKLERVLQGNSLK